MTVATTSNEPNTTGENMVKSLFFNGICSDSSKTTIYQKKSQQEFVRDEVFICQSIDPYKKIENANKIMALGESLFFNEKNANKNIVK